MAKVWQSLTGIFGPVNRCLNLNFYKTWIQLQADCFREQVAQVNQLNSMVRDIRQIVKNSHDMMKLNDTSFFFIHLQSLVEVSHSCHIKLKITAYYKPNNLIH